MQDDSRAFVSHVDANSYEPFPLEDADVKAGNPMPEVAWLRAETEGARVLYAGLFRAQPSTFNYAYAGHETVHVLEGEVEIRLENGEVINLREGDIASFRKGDKCTWKIARPFKKFFVIHS